MQCKKVISNIQKGMAGEHLVCADIYLSGYSGSIISTQQPYDIIMDAQNRMFKIQVKTSTFKPSRGNREGISTYFLIARGNKTKILYNETDAIDIFAFVNPNIGIWYISSTETMPKYKVILNEKHIYPLNRAISIVLKDKYEEHQP